MVLHQHDANFETGAASNRLMVLDNGNSRLAEDPSIHSRGQVIEIDEENRTATLVLNTDLGVFSRPRVRREAVQRQLQLRPWVGL